MDTSKQYLHDQFTSLILSDHVTALDIVSKNYRLLAQGENSTTTNTSVNPESAELIAQALQGHTVVSLHQRAVAISNQSDNQWYLHTAVPILNNDGTSIGVLLASQPIDNAFAQTLNQQSGISVALCLSGHMLSTTSAEMQRLVKDQIISEERLCNPDAPNVINTPQQYLTISERASIKQQTTDSPTLSIVAIEQLSPFNLHDLRSLLIVSGIGLFVLALGIIIYAFVTSVLLIRPLRRLQAHAQALITSVTGIKVGLPRTNELNMLANSYNLLADSLED